MSTKEVKNEVVCYKNPSCSEEERVSDLLSRMTLEEKSLQLRLATRMDESLADDDVADAKIREFFSEGFGAFYATHSFNVEMFNRVQRYLMEETRLGIPAILMGESLHGCMINGATSFPQALGLGATWNADLMAEIADAIGKETYDAGIRQVYAPNLDISQDPRWGRVEENYGEDPYLTARLGVAYVKGLQKNGVASSPKHYVAHGTPEGGLNIAPVHAGERELREIFLPPFAAVVQEGGAMSMMPAYSEWDGIPLHASRFLITDILRDELGFDGFTVSDFGAVGMMVSRHFTAETPEEASLQALRAGIDMEAPTRLGYDGLYVGAIKKGEIPIELIDKAVERILRIKFRLGLFESPYIDPSGYERLRSDTTIALARRTAQESAVLLRNENNLLPLSPDIGKVALIGPNANFAPLGDYTPKQAYDTAVNMREALTARLGADRIIHRPGCSIAAGSDQDIAEAVEAATNADVALLVMGDNSCYHGGIGWGDTETKGPIAVTCGEGFDLSDLNLPGRQQELLEAVVQTGRPVVLILMTGRPYAITWAADNVPAILQAWYPGDQGGHALCDLLFGDVNPSGKLPISFPRSVGHLPCYYNHKISARGYYKKPGTPDEPGRDYVFSPPSALFPFGYGLSYTTFEYDNLTATPEELDASSEVEISVTVKNSGKREGAEVVQLYLRDCISRITPYVKRLRGFQKVFLKPGESRRVSFRLNSQDFAFINEKMQPEVEPGKFEVMVSDLKCEFTVV